MPSQAEQTAQTAPGQSAEATQANATAAAATVRAGADGNATAPGLSPDMAPDLAAEPGRASEAANATYGSFLGGKTPARQTSETTASQADSDLLGPGHDLLGSAMTTAAYLCLLLGVIFLAYWLLRKFGPHGIAKNKGALGPRLMGRLVLGPKQHVDVVRIDGKTFVLGVTEQRINLLTELPAKPGQYFDDEDEDEFTDFAEMLGKSSGNAGGE